MLNAIQHAKEVKARLMNPPNAIKSDEIEITAEPLLRRQRIQQMREIETARRDVAWQTAFERASERDRQRKAEKLLEIQQGRIPKVDEIIAITAEFYGLSLVEMLSHRRQASVVRARHVASYLAKTLTKNSYPEIGRRMGNRDHTTILHSVRKVEWRLEREPGMRSELDALKRRLGR